MGARILLWATCCAVLITCSSGSGQEKFNLNNEFERAASDAAFFDFADFVVDDKAQELVGLTPAQVEKIADIRSFHIDAIKGVLATAQPQVGDTHKEIGERYTKSGAADLVKKLDESLTDLIRAELTPQQIERVYERLLMKRFEKSGIIGIVVSQRDVPAARELGLPPLREFLASMNQANEESKDELEQLEKEFHAVVQQYRQRIKAIKDKTTDQALAKHGIDPKSMREMIDLTLETDPDADQAKSD
jgi:hypothetical protein